MGVSAIYGIGIYNQSRYNQVFISGSTEVLFLSQGTLQHKGRIKGESKLSFTLEGFGVLGISSRTNIIFSDNAFIRQGITGRSDIVFSSLSDISAAPSEIQGQTILSFLQDAFLEGRGTLKGDTSLIFDLTAPGIGIAEAGGLSKISFSTRNSYLNVNRISTSDMVVFSSLSEIKFKSTRPYHPTWSQGYFDLSGNNIPGLPTIGLLYTRTSGETPRPYMTEPEETE